MVDSVGNVGLSFSASASTIYPGSYYTGRQAAGAFAPGEDFYFRDNLSGNTVGENRWGDYSSLAIDPEDESAFWAFGEYALPRSSAVGTPVRDGIWGTAWGAFSMRDYSLKNDFNGDGFSDLIVQDTTTGGLRTYQLNGYVRISTAKFKNSSGASLVVTQPLDIYTSGDFSGDEKTGFVLKNADTGALSLWRMNGIVKNGGYALVPATTSAVVQGAADFDGDGRTDLVLQNPTSGGVTIWYLGATGSTGVRTTRTASANLSPQLTNYLGQKIVGVTDYNGDGHPDLLLQDLRTTGGTSGNVTVILLNGGLQSSATITQLGTRQMVLQNFDRTIKVLGVDDINADGLADIVTRQGTAIAYRPRTIPAGQRVTTTQSFNFGNSQVFVGTDGVTPVVLPSTNWSIRN